MSQAAVGILTLVNFLFIIMDTDIQAFVETYPETERGTLRALARSARKEAPAGVKASKRLFQYLKTASKPR